MAVKILNKKNLSERKIYIIDDKIIWESGSSNKKLFTQSINTTPGRIEMARIYF